MSRTSNKNRRRSSRSSRSRQSSGSLTPWIVGGAVAVVVIGLVVTLVNQGGTIEGLQTFGSPERGHTSSPVTYPQTPPVGGAHSSSWQNCGIYDTPVPNELGVHSMEHGAVWITYQPGLPAESVAQLRALVRGRSHALLSPYEGLTEPIYASAWGLQISTSDPADPRLSQFMARYIQGPQTPEPGASCVGGLGVPVER